MELFSEVGEKLKARGGELPPPLRVNNFGGGYVASRPLARAVETALRTGLPLLVTGEPGCGKTQLAAAVAYQLDLPLLRFDTKSSSVAQDLLYRFDVVKRFYDANNQNKTGSPDQPGDQNKTGSPDQPGDYVALGPLGAAILLVHPQRESLLKTYRFALKAFPETVQAYTGGRCVVLIDEVDKAPRDFPNDLLNELENLRFWIAETEQALEADPDLRPIVILTSNAERDLPEPFLRRCAYFHIETDPADLETIVAQRLGTLSALTREALRHYRGLLDRGDWEKKPSVAELLIWLRLLAAQGVSEEEFDPVSETVRQSYSHLFKTQADQKRACP